jgi:hypothetical protein
VDVCTATAEIAIHAWGVVMRSNACPDWESCIVGLDDDAGDFMTQHMRCLAVHVPIHEFAGAKTACLGLDEQSAVRGLRFRYLPDLDPAFSDIDPCFHGLKTYFTPFPA